MNMIINGAQAFKEMLITVYMQCEPIVGEWIVNNFGTFMLITGGIIVMLMAATLIDDIKMEKKMKKYEELFEILIREKGTN